MGTEWDESARGLKCHSPHCPYPRFNYLPLINVQIVLSLVNFQSPKMVVFEKSILSTFIIALW